MSTTQGLKGILHFLETESAFVEYQCRHKRMLGSPSDVQYETCWEAIERDIAADRCVVLSVRHRIVANLSLEADLRAVGCKVHVLWPDENVIMERDNLKVHKFALSPVDDPFGSVPRATLDQIMETLEPGSNITLLHIQCNGCEWEVFNQLFLQGSTCLKRVTMLLMSVGHLALQDQHYAYALYQHLYQETGFVGYSHKRLVQATKSHRKAAEIIVNADGSTQSNSSSIYQLGFVQPQKLSFNSTISS